MGDAYELLLEAPADLIGGQKSAQVGPGKSIRPDHQQLVSERPAPWVGHFRLAEVSGARRPRRVKNEAGWVFVGSAIVGVLNQIDNNNYPENLPTPKCLQSQFYTVKLILLPCRFQSDRSPLRNLTSLRLHSLRSARRARRFTCRHQQERLPLCLRDCYAAARTLPRPAEIAAIGPRALRRRAGTPVANREAANEDAAARQTPIAAASPPGAARRISRAGLPAARATPFELRLAAALSPLITVLEPVIIRWLVAAIAAAGGRGALGRRRRSRRRPCRLHDRRGRGARPLEPDSDLHRGPRRPP